MILHASLQRRGFDELTPTRIAIIYVIFGLSLLFVSDYVFPLIFADPEILRGLQAIKGALEVGISGGLIYVLVTRSQEEIRETNELLEGVLDASPLAIVAADREGKTMVWSSGAEEMYGWSEEEVLGEPAPNVPDENWGEFEHLREERFEEGEPVIGYETTRRTKDGSRIDVSITTGAMRDETGDFIGIMAVQEDITEQKERERELERLSRIVDQLPVGVFRSTADGQFLDMNDGFVSLLDAESKDALMESDPRELYSDPDTREDLFETLQDEGVVVDQEIEVTTVTGDQKWVSSTLRLTDVDGEQYLEGVSLDITERKRQEQELKRTKQRLQSIIDASPIGIVSVDRTGDVQLWSAACERMFGWSEAEVLGEPLPNIPDEKQDEFDELWERVVEEGNPVVGYETVRQTKDGSLIEVALTTDVMRDAEGDVIGVMGLFEDITERKEQERQLRSEREQFEQVLETSPVGITLLDAEGTIERANDRAEEILGLTSTEIAGRQFDDMEWEIIDETGDPIAADELPFARVQETGEPVFNFEHGIRTPAGTKRWVSINASPLSISDGDVERVVAVISDVTEQRERKQALEESEARYRAIAETTPDAIVTIDGEGTVRFANEAVESVFGYSPEQLEGEPLTTLLPERFRDRHREGVSRFFETGDRRLDWSAVEFPGLHRNGDEVELSMSFASYDEDGEERITAIVRDISNRERMQRELDQREQTYRNLVENSPAPINLFDEEGKTVWGNDAVVDLLGLEDQDDLIGRSIFDFIHPADHDIADEELTEVIHGDSIVGPTNMRLRRPDGDVRYIQVKTVGGWYKDRRVGQAVVVDITDLREKEMELRQNEQRYRTLVEMSPDPILVHLDGQVVYANDALADLLDATYPRELVGTSLERYVDSEEHDEVHRMARQTQRGNREPTNHPYTVVTMDGERRRVETTSRPIAYEGEPAVLTIVKDVTERYEYEQTLRTLHERTQAMARAADKEEITRIAVEAMDELLDVDGTVMYEFRGDALVPLQPSKNVDAILSDLPVATKEVGFLWEVFAEGEARSFQDLQSSEKLPHDIPLHSAFALPVSNHGILLTGTTSEHSLTPTEREVAQLIGENMDAALDSAERESRLRERDRELERQNTRLEQLDRLNQIIRKTTQAIIQSRSQAEVKNRVCEEFAAANEYSFAWVGTRDEATGQLQLTQRAGMDPEYAEHLGAGEAQTPLHGLVAAALRDGSVQVARDVLDDPDWAEFRRDALAQEYRSVAVVPIRQNESIESALVIHGTASELFDDRERDVLAELGATIGYALRNVADSDTFQSPTQTELELRIEDEQLFLNQIATELGVDIEFVGAIPGTGETFRSFLRFTDHPDEGLETELQSFETVSDVQPLSMKDGVGLYQVTIATPQFVRILQGNDARLRALGVEDGTSTARLGLPGDASVRTIVDEIRAVYPDTTLQKRREDQNPIDTRETFRDTLLDQLTEKQLDALQTALYGGYYEWPRVSTSEELAATRDIAGSTFQHHLRAAERKLVTAVLDPV